MNTQNISKYIKDKLLIFTPISILVLILIAFFIVSVVKHQKILLQHQVIKVEVTGHDWTENSIQYEGFRPPGWLVENIEVGAKEYSPDGRVVAQITDIDYFERTGGNAQVFLTIEIETVDNFSSGRTIYKGMNIEIGKKVDFHFNNTFVVGQIVSINDVGYQNEFETVTVRGIYKGVPTHVASLIKPGMEVVSPFSNRVYALVDKVKQVPTYESVLYKDSFTNNTYWRTDYSVNDLNLELTLLVEKRLGNYYFSGHQVIKVGEKISLFFPEIDISPLEITDVIKTEEVTE